MAHDQVSFDWTDPSLRALLDGLGVEIVDGALKPPFELGPGTGPIHVAAVGWATVELDRAAEDLGTQLGTTFEQAHRDALLGATVRRSTSGDPGILLLEPDTEGRLSGALARFGEGPIALYVGVPGLGRLQAQLSIRAGTGPLGPARLVLAGQPWGPFLILVEREASKQAADRVPSEP
ncbi:MAG TPA: hypothetical protein VID26_02190 [Candidatus Limnocylindrales bacterium]|jgi:hypothetical protein